MITPELQHYVNQMKQVGKSEDEIRAELIRTGWPDTVIAIAFGLEKLSYSSIWRRLLAQLIDSVLWYLLVGSLMSIVFVQLAKSNFATILPLVVILIILPFIYFIGLENWFGATFGKMALGIKVASEDGSRANFRAIVTRNLLRVVDFLPTGYLFGLVMMMKSAKKQRYGDQQARTVVMRSSEDFRLKLLIGISSIISRFFLSIKIIMLIIGTR